MKYVMNELIANYVLTPHPPEGHSNRLYQVEPGCEYGFKEEDGYVWRRIQCSYWFGDWIETQDQIQWRRYGGKHRAIYVVREDLMTLIRLKWL